MNLPPFNSLPRQKFRQYFQPSRIVLAVLPAATPSGVNVITLCFSTYCSYKPPMMAVAIHNINASYELAVDASEYVLAVPGESMLEETLVCGTRSLRDLDKVAALDLKLNPSYTVGVPGLSKAIANIELEKESVVITGDHLVVIGRVNRFGINLALNELPLISIGPAERGYRLLARRGIHRIAVADTRVSR